MVLVYTAATQLIQISKQFIEIGINSRRSMNICYLLWSLADMINMIQITCFTCHSAIYVVPFDCSK